MAVTDAHITDCIQALAASRGPDKSLCPSEVARSLAADDWRGLMPRVRRIALEMAADGRLVIRQHGQIVDPFDLRGPIRLAQPPTSPR